MYRITLFSLLLLIFNGFQASFAADCITADFEVTQLLDVKPDNLGNGFFRVINCGQTDDYFRSSLRIYFDKGDPITIGPMKLFLKASEAGTHEFWFSASPFATGQSAVFCFAAHSDTAGGNTSGSAICGETTFTGISNTDKRELGFALQMVSNNVDCIKVENLTLSGVATSETGIPYFDASVVLTNCGSKFSRTWIAVSINFLGVILSQFPVNLMAGEEISKDFRVQIPPLVPVGEHIISLSAISKTALSTNCEYLMLPESHGSNVSQEFFHPINYPNPFFPSTTISFKMSQTGNVTMKIYNENAEHVRTLINEARLNSGGHSIIWDGTTGGGMRVLSGTYTYTIATDQDSVSSLMTLAK